MLDLASLRVQKEEVSAVNFAHFRVNLHFRQSLPELVWQTGFETGQCPVNSYAPALTSKVGAGITLEDGERDIVLDQFKIKNGALAYLLAMIE